MRCVSAMQIFTAPTVDANAAEQCAPADAQHHDQMSRRVTRAMLDVASVLTPEQRAKSATHARASGADG